MPGSKLGGKKAAQTLLKVNPDYYREIGAIGGAISRRGTANKLNKTERQAARKQALQRVQEHQERKEIYTRLMKQRRELSQMQTSKLSQKFGVKRSW